MIPTSRSLISAAALVIIALIADLWPSLQNPVIVIATLFALLLIADALRLLFLPMISIERDIDANIPVNEWVDVKLRLTSEQGPDQQLMVDEIFDQVFESRDLPRRVELQPQQSAELHYQLRAKSRGSFSLLATEYLCYSPLHLWTQRRRFNNPNSIKVQPNYQAVANLSMLGDEQRISTTGIRQQRRRGEGTEFHQLREYRNGDAMRKVDWKASSRVNKLISKEFRDEQDQQLVFLLDTGRRMRHKSEVSEFMDDTINAMLLLSHAASQQGDAVGFMAFGNNDHWCPPQKHKSMIKHLVDHCFDIQAGLVHSDYLLSAQRILELQKRRALIMILTNTRDEDNEDLQKAIVLLRKRHLVVIADLQESFFQDKQTQLCENHDDAMSFLTSTDYLNRRQEMQKSLVGLGAIYLDCTAKDLPGQLLSAYNRVKHSGRL